MRTGGRQDIRICLPAVVLLVAMQFMGFYEAAAQSYPAHSPLSSGNVFRIEIAETGMYRIGTAEVSALRGVRFDSIALRGHSGAMLPDANGSGMAHPLYNISYGLVDNDSDGVFDDDDALIFYGEGVDRWVRSDEAYRYVRHAYATRNCYYLVIGQAGHIVPTTGAYAVVASDTVKQYTVVGTHHNDMANIFQTGQVWVGERFSSTQTSRTFSISLPDAVSADRVHLRVALAHDGSSAADFSITLNGSSVPCQMSKNTLYHSFETDYPSNRQMSYSVRCDYTPSSGTALAYLDYIELYGTAEMRYTGGQKILRTEPTGVADPVVYEITATGSAWRVWDITDPGEIYEPQVSQTGSQARFTVADGIARQIIVFDEYTLLTPAGVTAIEAPDLAGRAVPDMIIVHPEEFEEAAERLAEAHRSIDGMDVMTVTPQEVYDAFSSGKQDPLAYRELLRSYYKLHDGQTAKYLLLFGHGTYDPRNILGDHGITLVTGEAYTSFGDNGNTYASDDMMGYLEDNEVGAATQTLDVAIGRLPAKNEEEASHLVNKIVGYMNRQDLLEVSGQSDWRNSIVLLADDADPGSRYDTIFTHDAERLATNIKEMHPQYNITRIFADAFVQQSGSSGSFYPDVSNAIRQRLNSGCLLLNYIGHGSTRYIGTERYISPQDIAAYSNNDRLTFFVTSTCSFGRADLTDDICGAESFLLSDGGGIGVVSATRPIVHHENFNTTICCELLQPENTVGDAWRIAKNRYAVSHSIVLFGDPALHLTLPIHRLEVTAINGRPVSDTDNDTAEVLSEVLVSGRVVDANGIEDNTFNGPLHITVYDRESESKTQANDNEGCEVTFRQQKDVLYRSRDSVRDGLFTFRFTVPMDVAYDYAASKISLYAYDRTTDATGAYTRLFLGGFDTLRVIEEIHPEVKLYLNDTNFRSGGSCDENPMLYAVLHDSIGINSVGSGLGHDITATLDGNGNTVISLNDFYRSDLEDSRGGTVSYQLSGLTAGWHTLTLKAWNIFNRSGSASLRFWVKPSESPSLVNFLATPNPAQGRTSIRIEHNCPGNISRVQVAIYDIRGRMVRRWESDPPADSYVVGPFEWRCDDASGHPVPNGIYTARIRYRIDGDERDEHLKIIVKAN